MNRTTSSNASRLKYLSIKTLIWSPIFLYNKPIKPPTAKNLRERLAAEATINGRKLISKNPAEIVKTLKGIGVKPAIATAQGPTFCPQISFSLYR